MLFLIVNPSLNPKAAEDRPLTRIVLLKSKIGITETQILDLEALYQDIGELPKPVQKIHFEEGLLYALILNSKKTITYLGMVILVKKKTFLFRVFGSQGTSAKTFHEGSSDKEFDFADVWRLAPRRDYMRPIQPDFARIGHTLRFDYEGNKTTVRVTRFTSNYVSGILDCGKDHGKSGKFDKIEMQDCQEMFASSLLQAMHSNLSDLE